MSKKDWAKFWTVSLLWGSQYLWVKIALRETGPFTITALRLLIAICGILIYHRITRPAYPQKTPWLAFIFLGLFNLSIPLALVAWSEKYITSGMASILNSTAPLFTVLLSWFFLKDETFSPIRLAGLALGFAGVILLVSNKATISNNDFYLGAFAVLLASVSLAVAAIYARRNTTHLHHSVQALGQVMVGTVVTLSSSILIEAPLTLPRLPQTWAAILIMGLLLTAIGVNLFFSLLNSVGATRTMMISYLYPLVGVILGIVFLGEEPTWQFLSGGALIIGGVILANSRLKQTSPVQEQT